MRNRTTRLSPMRSTGQRADRRAYIDMGSADARAAAPSGSLNGRAASANWAVIASSSVMYQVHHDGPVAAPDANGQAEPQRRPRSSLVIAARLHLGHPSRPLSIQSARRVTAPHPERAGRRSRAARSPARPGARRCAHRARARAGAATDRCRSPAGGRRAPARCPTLGAPPRPRVRCAAPRHHSESGAC